MKPSELSSAITAGQESGTKDLIRDLFPGRTTPFAWTLLKSPAETALRNAYGELGASFGIAGYPSLWLDHAYVYVNARAIAEADRALAGSAWLGRMRPANPGGLVARLQTRGVIHRAQARVAAVIGEAGGLQSRLSRWLAWVQGLKWTQADLLQVMEELEPHALVALQVYFLVRAGLNAANAEALARLAEWMPDCSPDVRLGLYLGVEDLPSVVAAEAVTTAAQLSITDPERMTTLARCGHRGPGEIRPDATRWTDATELLAQLATQSDGGWQPEAAAARRRTALAAVRGRLDTSTFHQFEVLLQNVHQLMRAADIAWDALTMVMAAAQRWAVAASREALTAGLIAQPSDVLYLELEELKQVATGEWHGGHRAAVQEEVARRMHATTQPCLAGYEDASNPSIPDACNGPLYCDSPNRSLPPPEAVWLTESVDPGCAPFWRHACALVTAASDVWAPGIIAARGMGVPVAIGSNFV